MIRVEDKRLLQVKQVIRGIPQKHATMWSPTVNENRVFGMKIIGRTIRTLPISLYNPNLDLIQRLIGEKGARLLRDQLALGRPRRSLRRGGSLRPRKASACSGN
ncbi:hypothetical protein [Heyndrickxia acidicola]|uniref:Uncharacterized protein n=1 Tax=Heyndrickxia acidicola TaxID=209389 RepID=A0ABU6MCK8_9BACI|nr:hypothetical protein [Heyndrickxia acidicola]MED1202403.1 hypothetical protein [Heyndrickxia acidicola]